MKRNFTSTVAGASILITAVGLIGKGLGLIREIVFANFFGLNTQYDLYLVGAVFPLTINTIILYLGQNYFIPNYNKLKYSTENDTESFINSTFWSFTFLTIIFSAVLFFFSDFIIKFYLQSASTDLFEPTIKVFRIFLITIPLNAAFSILAAYLQAEFEFKTPAFSQLLLNISIIILVITLSNKMGVYTIPAGYVLGSLTQFVFLLTRSVKKVKISVFKFLKERRIGSIINYTLIITILIESISQIYLLADRYFFDSVDKGGIASLNYAMNLYLLPVTIFSVALSTAIFPKLSQSFNSNLKDDLQIKLNNFFSVNLFIFIPISLIFILYGDLIIRILFQRGEFNSNATSMTFIILKYYSISLVFYSSYIVINKLMYGANLIKPLLIITAIGCAIKVVLNFILVKSLKQDGLAISTSVSYLFYFAVGILFCTYRLKIETKHFIKEFAFNLLNGIISFLVALVLIPVDFSRNFLLSGLMRLIIFLLTYFVNSKLAGQNTIRLFEDAMNSIYTNKAEST